VKVVYCHRCRCAHSTSNEKTDLAPYSKVDSGCFESSSSQKCIATRGREGRGDRLQLPSFAGAFEFLVS
jgi:hypothetical protein